MKNQIWKHSLLALAASILITICLSCIGILLGSFFSSQLVPRILLLICALIPAAVILLNQMALAKAKKKINDASILEIHEFLGSHRQTDHSRELYQALKRTRRQAAWVCRTLGASAVLTAVFSGMAVSFLIPLQLYAAALLWAVLIRIPSRPPAVDDSRLPAKGDYPYLYQMAENAQAAVGGTRQIHLDITFDCNAGIYVSGQDAYLNLGIVLLSILTEEELRAVLLHEFGHAAAATDTRQREEQYLSQREQELDHLGSQISETLFFSYFDTTYAIIFDLYRFSTTLQNELNADKAMVQYADPAAAGSALLKLAFSAFDDWEIPEKPSFYEPEEVPSDTVRRELARFHAAIENRKEVWIPMAEQEIQSRSATHPTLRSRLDAMGIEKAALVGGSRSAALESEVEKATDWLEQETRAQLAETYDQDRQVQYLEPLAAINSWKQEGEPLAAEKFPDVLAAFNCLSRFHEMEALCDRAIRELPIMSSHDAYYWKGILLLHRYDPEGLHYLYQAIEENNNHLEGGLEIIGSFCCLTGRQEELDQYREKAVALAQQDKDLYQFVNCLEKGDQLSQEQLPEDLMAGLLACLADAGQGRLREVYLVRKQITADFFTSAVVLKFRKGTPDGSAAEIFHTVFRYLDTATDWQFSLFDYRDVKKVHVERIPGSCIYEQRT